MTTDRDDRNYYGRNDENRERRPYSNNRDGYGNGSNYNRPYNNREHNDNRRSFGNREGGYDQNRVQQNRYDRPQQRPYDNQQRFPYENRNGYNNSEQGGGFSSENEAPVKKRRARVGESSFNRGGEYGNDRNQGGYDDNRRSNYGDNRGNRPQGGGYGNSGYGNNRGGNAQQGGRPQGGYGNNRGGYSNGTGGGYGNNRNMGARKSNTPGQGGGYNPGATYGIQKQLKYREEHFDPNEPIRLNKYLANAGVCSRREADEFIQAGVVKVNDEVVTELGTKVKRADKVSFHNEPVKLEQKIYVLLNKPKNCVTTADDPQERLTVMDLVKNACHERIFPVGRLDRNTTGVLLLTNDGDLASKLTHPKFLKKKIYHVWLDKNVSIDDMQKIADGIQLEDGEIHADAISYVTETDKDQIGIEIHSGRNRIVRRIFETLGYHVIKLDRVYFAGLTKKNLKRGQWRYLNDREVSMLRQGAFE